MAPQVTNHGNRRAPLPPPGLLNLYSDSAGAPPREMLETMLAVPVGDEQKGTDPTTKELLNRVADLLGKEDAILMSSGTMANEIGIAAHVRPGDEVVCERKSHIFNFEAGGPAALAGAQTNAIDGDRGMFTAEQLEAAIRPSGSLYYPETGLVTVEHTANFGGGAIWPLEQLREVAAVAKNAGAATMMDGARMFMAVAKTGISAREYAKDYDSVWFSFNKGLGTFFGAVLAGSEDYIQRAWRIRQRVGGGLHQSGFLAAPCLYALDNNIERLAEDNRRAADIGQFLEHLELVDSVMPVETNIVIFEIADTGPSAVEVVDQLLARGVRVGAFGARKIRIVTHLSIDDDDVARTCQELKLALSSS